ncbi:MAG: hypothetical protein II627_02625, partial [Lachnospiraceae bacterium]|nr:hypothetical protein [Lachnospiraceae bacterium]
MDQRTISTYTMSRNRISMIWAGMSLPLTLLTALTVILLTCAVPSACLAAGSQALQKAVPAYSCSPAEAVSPAAHASGKAASTAAHTSDKAVSTAADTSADPISLTSCQITLSKDTYTYNGKTHTPSARISYEGASLRKDRDYTVTYAG